MARSSRAFTLIEVVLAVGLTMGIVLAALAFYQQIIDTRQAFGDRLQTAEVTAARRTVMDHMTDDLRSAIVYRFLQMGLTGGPDGMQFMVAGLPGQDIWATGEPTDNPPEPQEDVRIIGWRLRIDEDANTGDEVIEGIERTVQKVITAQNVEEGVDVNVDARRAELQVPLAAVLGQPVGPVAFDVGRRRRADGGGDRSRHRPAAGERRAGGLPVRDVPAGGVRPGR